MKITIGEIIDEILPHANTIEIKTQCDRPFVHALMNNETLMSRFHMYIIQQDEHKYAACDTENMIDDKRYIPTGNSNKPLITEKEFIARWSMESKKDVDSSVAKDLDHDKFVDYLIGRLYFHEVIKFDPENYTVNISDLVSSGTKSIKAVKRIFTDRGYNSDTVRDLINIVRKNKEEISFESLKSKDFMSIVNKLTRMGLLIVYKDGIIKRIDFEKKK